jgi:hypothetical protein
LNLLATIAAFQLINRGEYASHSVWLTIARAPKKQGNFASGQIVCQELFAEFIVYAKEYRIPKAR